MGILPFIKIASIFVALIIFLRLKIKLSLAIFLLAVYTVILYAVAPLTALKSAGQILIAGRTLRLMVIVTMVLFIADVLKKKKMFDRLISSLNVVVRDCRIVAMIAPAIIGFLPMPGGALVSAPLVDASTCKMKMTGEFKTFLNFWFRHPWEFVWPVYAALLIFEEFSKIPLKTIILYQSPFTLLHIVSGLGMIYIYFRKHEVCRVHPEENGTFMTTAGDFFEGIWPILLVILLFFILSIPLYLSLTLVAVVVTVVKRVKVKEIKGILLSKSMLQTVLLIAMVMIFQQIVEVSGAFSALNTMTVSKWTLVFFVFVVSFSMGFLTGVNTSFIIISYPILKPMLISLPPADFLHMSIYVYVIGMAGILSSPVHLCLVLTNQYFKSSLYKVYRYLAPPVIVMILVATFLVMIL